MSENPYAAQSMQGPAQTSDFGSGMPAGPARTSTLAIIAFVIAILSIVGCCVPGLPAIAALLGIFAIIGIGKSGGRVKGNGFAIAALVIGILLSVVQTVALIVANQGIGELTKLSASIDEVETDQFDAVRSRLPSVDPALVTDEAMIAFRDAYTADTGEFVEAPSSLLAAFGQYIENGELLQQMSQPGWPYPQTTFPIPAEFVNETGFVLFVPDESAPQSFLNLGVMGSDGATYWLIDPNGGSSQPADPDADPALDPTAEDTSEDADG